jgi:hypothetical protein
MAMTELDATQWQRHVTRWRAGHQTVPAYCAAHGLAVATMRYQIRRHATAAVPAPAVRVARAERVAATPVATAPVAAPTPPAAIVIEVGRARVRVEAGADAATLTTVLSALAVAR